VAELGEKIVMYRGAFGSGNGNAQAGNVVLMLHTFVCPDDDRVRELVRADEGIAPLLGRPDRPSQARRLQLDYSKPRFDVALPR